MKKLKEIYNKIFSIKGVNKYTIVTTIFLVIILFIDKNSILKRYKSYREKQSVERRINELKEEIKYNTEFMDATSSNTEALEKFAREKYQMKKNNEDIYIIKED